MTRVAFLFPGQGAKRVHEALRFVARTESGRARCDAAARAADVALERVIARPSLLDRTEVLQPILTAIALSIVERLSAEVECPPPAALRASAPPKSAASRPQGGVLAGALSDLEQSASHGFAPDIVLGHSAGEIAAWAAAGGITIEQAIELAALRGRLMAREAALHPGGMVALATSDAAVIESALAKGRESGEMCIAALNAPDETVLSGDESAVRAVLAFAPALATRIPTSGAWHSRAMLGAEGEWRRALAALSPRPLCCAFVANRTGEIGDGNGAPCDIPSLLVEQLTHPVQWARALATVRAHADVVVTIGPGAVIRALWHRCFDRRSESRGALSGPLPEPAEPAIWEGRTREARPGVGIPTDTKPTDTKPTDTKPMDTKLLATDDERAIAETIAYLRGLE